MGVMLFRVHPPELTEQLPELSSAYVTGMDRLPLRSTVEVRPGLLVCRRESQESGRLHVSWPVPGRGRPVISTATLNERGTPYDLGIELARGRLNDVRNQSSDWVMLGLSLPESVQADMREARAALAHAVTAGDDADAATESALASLNSSLRAADGLMRAYIEQVLQRRCEGGRKLTTLLSTPVPDSVDPTSSTNPLEGCLNAARVQCDWRRLAPTEHRLAWETLDAQLDWCERQGVTATAGPLIEFRPGALPDWLWLWAGDFEEIQALTDDLVRQVVTRYRGRIAVWHLVHRMAAREILGLTEEEQVRLTIRALRVARQIDPNAQLVIDFERPWAGWTGSSDFQLGPLQLADSLARAELGLSGIGVELAPGYSAPGSFVRDLLDTSRLLDLFALLNMPVHVSIAIASAGNVDPLADDSVQVLGDQWPSAVTAESQATWAADWLSLAAAKPYVRSVNWCQASDASPHVYPHAGLLDANGKPRPLVAWLRQFRSQYLGM